MSVANYVKAGAGSLVAQAVSVVCLPVLFRMYSPLEYAPWAIALAVVTLVGGLATLRYELAIVIAPDEESASAIFWLTLGLGVTVALAAGALLGIPSLRVFLLGSEAGRASISWLLAAWMLAIAGSQAFTGWALRHGHFGNISFSQAGNALVTNAAQIGLGVIGAGGWGLVCGSLAGQTAALGILASLSMRSGSRPIRVGGVSHRLRQVARTYRNFPLYSTPFSFFTIARERAAILILNAFAVPTAVGLYSQAWRVMGFPVGLTSSAIRPVLFHDAARAGLPRQERRINHLLFTLTLMAAPWVALLLCFPEELFSLALGSRWSEAGPLAAIIIFPAVLFMLCNWMDRLLDLLGRQRLALGLEMLCATTSLGAMWWALAAGKGVRAAVLGQCAVLVVNYAVYFVVVYRVASFSLQPLLVVGAAGIASTALVYAVIARLPLPVAAVIVATLGIASAAFAVRTLRRST